jgi:hypothetical protein
MPFTSADADKHKKGMTPKQKKQWASVANSVLNECIKKGGNDESCAPKAIRIASGAVNNSDKAVDPAVASELLDLLNNMSEEDVEKLEQLEQQEEQQEEVEHLEQLGQLDTDNNPPKNFWAKVKAVLSELDTIVSSIKAIIPNNSKSNNSNSNSDFFVWKEATTGDMMWIARYSNNFRDNDNPPEIISAASHKRFADRVDKGLSQLPELWLWHRPEWRFGKAVSVAYDDAGFAIALGKVDKDKEWLAEQVNKQNDVAVSHGMPKWSIVRDTDDPTVIVEHETVEISPLPRWAAANKLTGFVTFGTEIKSDKQNNQVDRKEVEQMAIPENKINELVERWGIAREKLEALQQENVSIAEEANKSSVESKEATQATQAAEATEATNAVTTEPVVEQKDNNSNSDADSAVVNEPEKVSDPLNEYPTRAEVADAFVSFMQPYFDRVDNLAHILEGLTKEVSALKEDEEAKIKQAIVNTPPASVSAILAERLSAIGSKETKLDEGDKLANQKPKETEVETVEQRIGISFLDKMLSDGR